MNSLVISDHIDRTFEILDSSPIVPDDQITWMKEVGNCLLQWGEIGNYSVMVEAKILYSMYKKWNFEGSLSWLAKAYWNHRFMDWAKAYTKSRGEEQADITITNKISVYRDWIAEPVIEYPEFVVINDQEVPFDPQECDYSKLLQGRASARQGILTEKAWAIIADPKATVTQLKNEIKGTPPPPPDEYSVIEEDGIFYAIRKGKKIPLMSVIYEYVEDELFQKGMVHVFNRLGLRTPAEYV